jgi:hypothetical protein
VLEDVTFGVQEIHRKVPMVEPRHGGPQGSLKFPTCEQLLKVVHYVI